jgi:hypothetical protein
MDASMLDLTPPPGDPSAWIGQGDGYIQSLVLGGVLVLAGFMAYPAGLVADLISFNRQLLEMIL